MAGGRALRAGPRGPTPSAVPAAFNEVRREFLLLTEQLLPAAGCTQPREHAPELLALLDGLLVNQLFQPATVLSEAEMVDYLERFFISC